jgi:hypothetical protein
MTTYTKRTNAKRAAVTAGIPEDQVEITVHKKDGEVRFGFKRKVAPVAEAAPAPAAKPAAATNAPAAEREQRNGVKRPRAGGACAAVWEWLGKHPGATVKEAKAAAADHGWNENNVSCEYYQHRKFNSGARTTR